MLTLTLTEQELNNCCLQKLCWPFHPYHQSFAPVDGSHSSLATAPVVSAVLWAATAAGAVW